MVAAAMVVLLGASAAMFLHLPLRLRLLPFLAEAVGMMTSAVVVVAAAALLLPSRRRCLLRLRL